jgi:hypothetical protein
MPLGVVLPAADWIAENLVCLVDVLKLQGRAGRGIAIRMIAPSEAAEGRIHFRGVSGRRDLEHHVIVDLSANYSRHGGFLSYRNGA